MAPPASAQGERPITATGDSRPAVTANDVPSAIREAIHRYRNLDNRQLAKHDHQAGLRVVRTQAELERIWTDPAARNILVFPQEELYITTKPAAWRIYVHSTPNEQDWHTIPAVRVYADMQLTVTGAAVTLLYNSAQATAFDESLVFAWDSAQVTAVDTTRVKSHGSSTVTAGGQTQVHAFDSAKITASGNATVKAYDSTQVIAFGAVRVHAFTGAQVQVCSPRAEVTGYDPGVNLWVTPSTSATTEDTSPPITVTTVDSLPLPWEKLVSAPPALSLQVQATVQAYRALADRGQLLGLSVEASEQVVAQKIGESTTRVRLARTQQQLDQILTDSISETGNAPEAIFILPDQNLRLKRKRKPPVDGVYPPSPRIHFFVHDIHHPGKTSVVKVHDDLAVTVTGTAIVEVHHQAQVAAFGHAQVKALVGSVRITATDHVLVVARNSVQVVASGHARVEAGNFIKRDASGRIVLQDHAWAKVLDPKIRVAAVGNSIRIWTTDDNRRIAADPTTVQRLSYSALRQKNWEELNDFWEGKHRSWRQWLWPARA